MKKKRTLLLTIPVAIVLTGLVAYQYGYVKLQEKIALVKEEKGMKLRTLEKYANVLAEEDNLSERLSQLKNTRGQFESRLIAGDTPSLAAAALLDIVKTTITGRGGRISSEQIGKTEELGHLAVINVNIDAVIPDSGVLGEILYAFENRTQWIVVDEIEVQVVNIRDPREINTKMHVSALTE
jgi:hypothetical protein